MLCELQKNFTSIFRQCKVPGHNMANGLSCISFRFPITDCNSACQAILQSYPVMLAAISQLPKLVNVPILPKQQV